jgi:voltage-gated potassium channel Kch
MDRFRYRFDNLMARGPMTLIGVLFLMAALLVVIVALVVAALTSEGQQLGMGRLIWMGLMRTLDPGTMGGDEGSLVFLAGMFTATLAGIFVVGALIGILTTGLDSKLEELRKGRSLVVEKNHTVILGWSPQIFSIVSELVIANANQRNACIAILAEKDKVEIEAEIRDKVGPTGRTRVVCRTGSPIDLNDLEIVNPHAARSIIILSPEKSADDSETIKTILALTNNPHRRAEPYHIVAEIKEAKNLEAARLVGRNEAELVLTADLIARITAQTCRQSGLSVVYTELLDFGGDEIYFKEEPGLIGKTYGEALMAYETSSIIGVSSSQGRVKLNPPMDTCFEPGDQVIAISEDDDTIQLSGLGKVPSDRPAIDSSENDCQIPEKTLILGWNSKAPKIVHELDNYVVPGSEITVVAGMDEKEMEICCHCELLQNLGVKFFQGDPTSRALLDELVQHQYDHVITLGDLERFGPDEADSRTLVTLLHLRDIANRSGHPFSIVSEMLDVRNRALAEVTRADDFIVSDKLVSLMLSQISENKQLSAVFEDLFDPDGSELYLKPAGRYVELGKPVNFYTVLEAARLKGETPIGYRIRVEANNPAKSYGVRVNPRKMELVSFEKEDRIILLAED